MKKAIKILSASLLSATVIASAALSVSAAGINSGEQKILDELKTTVTMSNNAVKTLPSAYINQAENYFNTVDITDAQADEIVAKIEDVKTFLANSGADRFDALSDSQVDAAVEKCQAVVGVINAKLSYDKSTRTVTITDKDGNTIFTASGVGADTNPNNNGSKQQPGGNSGNNGGNSGNNGGSGSNGNTNPVINDNPIKVTGFDFNIPGVMSVVGTGILLVSAAGVYLITTRKKAAREKA